MPDIVPTLSMRHKCGPAPYAFSFDGSALTVGEVSTAVRHLLAGIEERTPHEVRHAIHPDAPPGGVHRPLLTYRQENRRTLNIIARRTGFVHGAAAMTGYDAVEPHGGITVGSPITAALIDGVVSWIVSRSY